MHLLRRTTMAWRRNEEIYVLLARQSQASGYTRGAWAAEIASRRGGRMFRLFPPKRPTL